MAANRCSLRAAVHAPITGMVAPENGKLFREQATRAAGHRFFSPVSVVLAPSALPACGLGLLAVACLVAALFVIQVPERVRASGALLPSKGLLKVQALRSGWVRRLQAENGATVKKGQVLMWLTDTQHAPERRPEAVEQLRSLQRELALLEKSAQWQHTAMERRRQATRHRKALLAERQLIAGKELETRISQYQLEQRRSARMAGLAGRGLVAAQAADSAAADAMQAQLQVEAARRNVLALQDEAARLDDALLQDELAAEIARTQAALARESLQREIATVELRSAVAVTAEGEGVVAGLAARNGSFVQAGQVLLTLYDAGDPLQARMFVNADNAAMIVVGQKVELRLRAYPYQFYGTRTATVIAVSASALPPREIGATAAAAAVFEVRASLDSDRITAGDRDWPLAPGTPFDADLIRERWSLYRWLIRSRMPVRVTDG
jgi:membrane fusion protein